MKNKGFTLAELLAVIIILALLVLIATPIVLNIIEKAREATDKSSLARYATVLKQNYFEKKLENSSLSFKEYLSSDAVESISYTGSKVICEDYIVTSNDDIELRNCTVNDRGYYNYVDGEATKGETKINY